MVEINIERSLRYVASRVSAGGNWEGDGFPVKRGSTLKLDDRTALVWVHGATEGVDGRRTYYQGKSRIPEMPATVQSSNQIARIGALLERFGPNSYDYRLFI